MRVKRHIQARPQHSAIREGVANPLPRMEEALSQRGRKKKGAGTLAGRVFGRAGA